MMTVSAVEHSQKSTTILWAIRVLVAIVFLWNIQCTLAFLIFPARYTSSFQLPSNVIGITIIRSIGLLFLMWNVPYFFAALQPIRWKICLDISFIQQFIGVLGELWILSSLPTEPVIRSSILRFLSFDATGLVILAIASGLFMYHQTKWKGIR
jgi:hypothetical protein